MTNNDLHLVYLAWPEPCFAATAADIRYLKTLLPSGARVRMVRTEKAFLRLLPQAGFVYAWNFREAWFALAPKLKLLSTPAAGRELISQNAPAGVRVHFGGFHGAVIAETVLAYMLSVTRGFFDADAVAMRECVAAGRQVPWPRTALGGRCRRLSGTRAVIAGYGRIGRAIGALLATHGVEVAGFGRRNAGALAAACRKADWFVMALPGDESTRNFLDARKIGWLPRRARVINVGRGGSIDEAALFAALRKGRLAGAYLDVRVREPNFGNLEGVAAAAHPFLPAMPAVPNLVLMPHACAFYERYIRDYFKELHDERLI